MMELSEDVEDELTCCSSILFDTIDIQRKESCVNVELQLGPLTASDEDLSYVGILLCLSLGSDYPDEPPAITVKCPRGLSESDVNRMMAEMKARCESMPGCPVVFELVDFCREFLTDRNVPDGPCPICLVPLGSSLEFCKTPCFHYFHSYCLLQHFRALERDQVKLICPSRRPRPRPNPGSEWCPSAAASVSRSPNRR